MKIMNCKGARRDSLDTRDVTEQKLDSELLTKQVRKLSVKKAGIPIKMLGERLRLRSLVIGRD